MKGSAAPDPLRAAIDERHVAGQVDASERFENADQHAAHQQILVDRRRWPVCYVALERRPPFAFLADADPVARMAVGLETSPLVEKGGRAVGTQRRPPKRVEAHAPHVLADAQDALGARLSPDRPEQAALVLRRRMGLSDRIDLPSLRLGGIGADLIDPIGDQAEHAGAGYVIHAMFSEPAISTYCASFRGWPMRW